MRWKSVDVFVNNYLYNTDSRKSGTLTLIWEMEFKNFLKFHMEMAKWTPNEGGHHFETDVEVQPEKGTLLYDLEAFEKFCVYEYW